MSAPLATLTRGDVPVDESRSTIGSPTLSPTPKRTFSVVGTPRLATRRGAATWPAIPARSGVRGRRARTVSSTRLTPASPSPALSRALGSREDRQVRQTCWSKNRCRRLKPVSGLRSRDWRYCPSAMRLRPRSSSAHCKLELRPAGADPVPARRRARHAVRDPDAIAAWQAADRTGSAPADHAALLIDAYLRRNDLRKAPTLRGNRRAGERGLDAIDRVGCTIASATRSRRDRRCSTRISPRSRTIRRPDGCCCTRSMRSSCAAASRYPRPKPSGSRQQARAYIDAKGRQCCGWPSEVG